MAALDVTEMESNYLNYSTGLLVSILLRYPEIGTISCCKQQQTLILKFIMSKESNFESLQAQLIQALEIFHKIEGRKMKLCCIEKYEQELDLLIITRDLQSITQNEINLIVGILKSELGKNLIMEDNNLLEDEILLQEEVISYMLTAIRSQGTEKSITAVREDGKVLVFNG
ncbi:MAG: hypothetical protein AWM53_00909 [Candidatus Dichloromethanomonas elyunquensis]|nr:MAG: hypothetical protein AWM53_00909 [Candidatus Dichloromethanomonas elyunquensis]